MYKHVLKNHGIHLLNKQSSQRVTVMQMNQINHNEK